MLTLTLTNQNNCKDMATTAIETMPEITKINKHTYFSLNEFSRVS